MSRIAVAITHKIVKQEITLLGQGDLTKT